MGNQRQILSKNLKRLIKSKGIDQKQLAEHLGISEMAVSNWVQGNKYPRISNIQKMADYFGVKKSDLIEDKENVKAITSTKYNYFPTPISAGLPIEVDGITENEVEQISIPDVIMGKWAGHKDIFVTRINGDSMNRVMGDGSLIAVKPVELSQLKNGDIVVYCYDGEYAVKRFYKQDNKIIFRPDSSDLSFTDLVINVNDNELDLKIKGKVVLYIVELN